MAILRVNKTFPPEHQTWAPMDAELRNRWCQVLIDAPPIFLGVTMMVMAQGDARANGFHDSGDWIEIGKEFDAAGFTPEEFLELNLAIRDDRRSSPWPHADPDQAAEYVTNSLITVSSGQGDRRMIRLRASDWLVYLERVRVGESPGSLATELLAPHWGEPAKAIVD